jgi:hypothetical protein
MGREEQDSSVIHSSSSIALLQERFRQLQRVKEMREERELIRMLAEPKQLNLYPSMPYEQPSRLFFHSELIIPPRSPPQVSLSVSPPSQSRWPADYSVSETPLVVNSWRHTDHRSFEFNDSDSDHSKVDTSLHL